MENSINQLYTLFVFILSGAVIGILFDLFRILRKSFKTPDIITYIEDILFWILTGLFLLYIIFKYSFGQLRIYMFVSLIIGIVIYFLTISKYFIKLNVKTIRIYKIYYIKNFIRSILPYKNNIRKFCLSFLKNLTKILKSVNISKKKRKNYKEKKDFTL